jgi:hypothetical protein
MRFTAGNLTQEWTADDDYMFTGAWGPVATVGIIISFNPSYIASSLQTPTAPGPVWDFIYNPPGTTGMTRLPCRVPIRNGQMVYFVAGAATSCVCYLEPISDEDLNPNGT